MHYFSSICNKIVFCNKTTFKQKSSQRWILEIDDEESLKSIALQ